MTDEAIGASIAVLKPEPGDILVLEHPLPMKALGRTDLTERVERVLPDGVTCLVLDSGVKVAAVHGQAEFLDSDNDVMGRIARTLESMLEEMLSRTGAGL